MSSGFLPASDTFSSISCLHALEHMGLGRYGDPIDPLGHHKAVKNLASMLSPNGTLYLSHPCGRIGRTEFNAHRVITLLEMKHLFDSLSLQVVSFSYVDDNGCLVLGRRAQMHHHTSNELLERIQTRAVMHSKKSCRSRCPRKAH